MQKQNIFVVTGRVLIDGVPRGAIKTVVVCAETSEGDRGVRKVVAEAMPDFGVTTVTGLVALEERVAQIKKTLAGQNPSWGVIIDPRLQAPQQAAA